MIDPISALELWMRRLMLRSRLRPEIVHAVMQLPAQEHVFATGRDVVRLGDLTTDACLIADGVVGQFHQDGEGLRQVSAVFIPGDMADLHSVPLPKASSSLTALGPVRVLKIPHEAIRRLTQTFPDFAEACWRDCTVDAEIASQWVFALGRFTATARLAHLLCELGLRFELIGGNRDRYALPLTQSHLGEVLGLTSVHVNRTLRDLREAGIADMSVRMVVIHDWDRLADAGQFDPRYLHLEQEPQV